MKKTVKVYACIPRVYPLDPEANYLGALEALEKADKTGVDLFVLPPLFLTGGELGSLSGDKALSDKCAVLLGEMAKKLSKERITVLAGIPRNGEATLALLSSGNVRYGAGGILSFDVQGNRVMALYGAQLGLAHCAEAATSGTDIMVFCDYSPAVAGVDRIIEGNMLAISKELGISTCFIRGGRGDTSCPGVYRAAAGFCRSDEVQFYKGEDACGATASLGGVLSEGGRTVIDLPQTKPLSHPVRVQKQPFIPLGMREDVYCLDIFDLQCHSLAARLSNLHLEKVVLGLSGGLDSCLALLVAAGAMDMLGLPRSGIIALIMPGFGTGAQTMENARALAEGTGATMRTVDITAPARALFAAIGHDETVHDTVYENVQARVRTAAALSVANGEGAIMVGTGDLSESALGFCTFGGDQIASYNVNVCLPKSLMRILLPIVTRQSAFVSLDLAVHAVLNTPVSPELLPPKDGQITQKTEEILAPYELLDFFLYCFAFARLNRAETLENAALFFAGEYGEDYMAEKLDLFYRRFVAGQFKRSCTPEAAAITQWNLLGDAMRLPSDMKAMYFIHQ